MLPTDSWLEVARHLEVTEAARLSRTVVAARGASAHLQCILRRACRVGAWAWLSTLHHGRMVVRLDRVDGPEGELVGTRRGMVGETDAEFARHRPRRFRFARPRILRLEPETAHAGLPDPSDPVVTFDRYGNMTMTMIMYIDSPEPTDADAAPEPPRPLSSEWAALLGLSEARRHTSSEEGEGA